MGYFYITNLYRYKKRWAITHLLEYIYAVVTVQRIGIPLIPLTPVTFHVAALDLTNVPLNGTPDTQRLVYVPLGLVVNSALM